MNNTNILLNVSFAHPWLLLLIIPAVVLALIPFLRLKKKRRNTRNRITSLILHIIIIICSVIVIAGIDVRKTEQVNSEIIILKDESLSTKEVKEEIDDYVEQIVKTTDNRSKIGIVSFGYEKGDTIPLQRPRSINLNGFNSTNKFDKTATDVENGLFEALLMFNKDSRVKKRIILLSDGLETDGDINHYVEELAKNNIEFNVIFFAPKDYTSTKEFQVEDVRIDERVLLGSKVDFEVVVKSHKPSTATIKIFDNDKEITLEPGKEVLNLKGGEEIFNFTHIFKEDGTYANGLHVLRVELSSKDDLVLENNIYYAYTILDSERNILIIANGNTDSSLLETQIKANEYNAIKVTPDTVPNSANALSSYGEVIMMNVDARTLPKGFEDEVHKYVEEFGGSLLVSGGESTLSNGYFEGTRFEEMLPVEVIPKANNPRAIVICLDISNSMFMNDPTGKELYGKPGPAEGREGTCIDVARKGIINALENGMNPYDYLGIVVFGRNKEEINDTEMVLDLTPATEKAEIKAIVNNIHRKSSEGSTNYDEALIIAKNMLDTCPYEVNSKSVVLINDDDGDNDLCKTYSETIEAMVNPKDGKTPINFSTIVVSKSISTNISNIGNITGMENVHQVQNAVSFGDVIYELCKSIPSDKYNNINGVGIPTIEKGTPITKNMTGFPEISEYNGVSAKKGATVYVEYHNTNLVTDDNGEKVNLDNHDPIYAQWEYGDGKVGALMIDLVSKACIDLYKDENGKQFIKNIINSLYPTKNVSSSDILAQFEKVNYTTEMTVTLDDSQGNMTAYVNVVNPDASSTYVGALLQVGSDYDGNIETKQAGVYEVQIMKLNDKNQTVSTATCYTTFSYSKEYNTFYDMQEVLAKLGKICDKTNGKVYNAKDDISTNIAEMSQIEVKKNVQILLMILALILFLLDICVRKFNFLWPHEIIAKQKEKRKNKK